MNPDDMTDALAYMQKSMGMSGVNANQFLNAMTRISSISWSIYDEKPKLVNGFLTCRVGKVQLRNGPLQGHWIDGTVDDFGYQTRTTYKWPEVYVVNTHVRAMEATPFGPAKFILTTKPARYVYIMVDPDTDGQWNGPEYLYCEEKDVDRVLFERGIVRAGEIFKV